MPKVLPDDELLDIPLANLRAGELARVFTVRAQHDEKKQESDLNRRTAVQATQLRQTDQAEHEHFELERREEVLLESIHAREQAIFEEA